MSVVAVAVVVVAVVIAGVVAVVVVRGGAGVVVDLPAVPIPQPVSRPAASAAVTIQRMGPTVANGPALLASAMLAALAAAPGAAAQDPCSVIERGAPARAPGAPRPPLVVGDSSSLLAVAPLVALGIEADARGCRQTAAAVDILAARRRGGTLPRVAVLAVGANGTVTGGELRRAAGILGPRRMLGLVTTPTPAGNAQAMRAYAAAHPARTILIDWAASGIPQRYGGDGLHIGSQGEAAMARLIFAHLRPYVRPRRTIPFGAPDAKACGRVRGRDVLVLRGQQRILCPRARQLVAARRPAAIRNWLWWDWTFVGRPPWTAVFARSDGKVIVAARRPAPAPARGTRPPGSSAG